jgi:hypothetical protein
MASALYPSFKEALLNKEIDLSVDDCKVCAIDNTVDETSYTSSDTVLTDIVQYTGSTAQSITSPTIASGVFDGANVTFSSLSQSASKTVGTLIIYDDTTATDKLVCWIDGFTAVVPNGGDITVTWGANIFSL